MPPLLILFIHLGVGGVQRKIVDIVNFLASYQPNLPIFILLRNKESFDLSPEIKNQKVKIINYQDWAKIKIPLFFPFFIIYQIWRLKPGSVLAFLDFVSLPAIWAKLILFWRKFRLVLSEDHYASRVVATFTLGRLRNFLMKVFYPFAEVIFVCSQATKRDLIKNYGLAANKIKIIRNWTTFTRRKPAPADKQFDLIYIGRLFRTKNLKFLIKATSKLKKKKKNISLCFLGAGPEKENLQLMAARLDLGKNVEFIEPRLGVENMLARSKILVLCSKVRAEGFPLVILEAMAVGTPVLTREFSGAKEFLKEKENCFLFKTGAEFIRKALWLLNNDWERKKIADKASKYVKKCHSSQNILGYLKELNLLQK